MSIFFQQISYFLCQYPYFVCPVEYSEKFGKMIIDCEPSPLYTLHEYILPEFIAHAMSVVSIRTFLKIISNSLFFFFLTII